MNRNMKKWAADLIAAPTKKALPLLSFPSVQLMGISVGEIVASSRLQAEGIRLVANKVDSAAAVSFMDLSVEAEAFGSAVHLSDSEVPTIIGHTIDEETDPDTIKLPSVGDARCGVYVDAISAASKVIDDRPIFAGVIGPYSLAGRLMDISEIMILCYDDPDKVHAILRKATDFIISYIDAFKTVGSDGVIIAEPLAGMLSPALAEEFSHPYIKKIVDSVQSNEFIVIYHNCGNNVSRMAKGIYSIGAAGYHFGDAVHLSDMLPDAPSDSLVMGNVSPSAELLCGTPDSVREATLKIMSECSSYPNFVISSGCDIPPNTPWENIDAFFSAVQEFYSC